MFIKRRSSHATKQLVRANIFKEQLKFVPGFELTTYQRNIKPSFPSQRNPSFQNYFHVVKNKYLFSYT